MKNFLTIFRKELGSYFISPIAYIFIIVFLFISCGLFMTSFFLMNVAEMRSYFNILPWILVIFIPAVTMRLWSEERRSATIALLQSFPMSSIQLVLGKFAASLLFFTITLASTLTIPLMLGLVGTPDWGPILGGYFGALFLGAFYLSAGLFVSAFFRDQIVSFILSMVLCFIFYMLGTEFVAAAIDGWIPQFGSFLSSTVGLAGHFSSIERGVLDIRDIIYFSSFSAIFLILNAYTLDSSVKLCGRGKFVLNCFLLLGVGILLNILINPLHLGRFDLTSNGIYTISESSRNIMGQLKNVPVEITYYVTPRGKMPTSFKGLEQDVMDKLTELQRLNANININVVDPSSGIEDLAVDGDKAKAAELAKKIQDKMEALQQKGIVPFDAQSIEQDSFNIKRVYSAISIAYLDKKEEVLPVVVPQNINSLEYELVSKIFRMTLEEKPRVAMIAPVRYADPRLKDPAMRQMMQQMGQKIPPPVDNFKTVEQFLRQQHYDVSRIDLTKSQALPDNVKTILVFKPQDLNARQCYEINKAVAEGANLLIAVQVYNYGYMSERTGGISVTPQKLNTKIDPLLGKYGIKINEDILMDANQEILSIPSRRNVGGFTMMHNQPVKKPIQIRVLSENLNKDVSITDQLGSLFYLWGSSLDIDNKKISSLGLKIRVLASSGDQSWHIPSKKTPISKSDIDPDLHELKPGLPLAVLLEGKFPFAYKGEEIPGWPVKAPPQQNPMNRMGMPAPQEKPGPSEGPAPEIKAAPSKVVVVGCAEMFNDQAVQGGGNPLFLMNAIDSLTLGDDLINIRSKGKTAVRFGEVSSASKLMYKFMTVGLVPLFWIIIGIIRLIVRRKRRAIYQKMMSATATKV